MDISYSYHPFFGTVGDADSTSTLSSRLEVGLGGAKGTLRFLAATSGWWVSSSLLPNLGNRYKAQVRFSRKLGETPEMSLNGAKQNMYSNGSTTAYIGNTGNVCIFTSRETSSTRTKYRAFYIAVKYEGVRVQNFIPALDSSGCPCMFDTVTRKALRNAGTGAFIAGIDTQNQLDAMLRKLPDRTGQDVGTLQVRLADALQTPENEAKLEAMLAKNWEISQAT